MSLQQSISNSSQLRKFGANYLQNGLSHDTNLMVQSKDKSVVVFEYTAGSANYRARKSADLQEGEYIRDAAWSPAHVSKGLLLAVVTNKSLIVYLMDFESNGVLQQKDSSPLKTAKVKSAFGSTFLSRAGAARMR